MRKNCPNQRMKAVWVRTNAEEHQPWQRKQMSVRSSLVLAGSYCADMLNQNHRNTHLLVEGVDSEAMRGSAAARKEPSALCSHRPALIHINNLLDKMLWSTAMRNRARSIAVKTTASFSAREEGQRRHSSYKRRKERRRRTSLKNQRRILLHRPRGTCRWLVWLTRKGIGRRGREGGRLALVVGAFECRRLR
jgi:hypothetical protein